MIPSHRNNPQQVTPQNTLTVDRHITVYVLLAGVAGGLMLAVVVMVCCKVCLRRKKPLTRQHLAFSRYSDRHSSRSRKYHSLDSSMSMDIETSCGYPDSSLSSSMACTFLSVMQLILQWKQSNRKMELKEFDPDELLESGLSQSWAQAVPDSGPEDFGTEIELQELPMTRASTKRQSASEPKHTECQSDSSSPERPPEVTSVVRRRSSVGIQRQASVCLSDEEDQAFDHKRIPEDIAEHEKLPEIRQKEVTRVAAIVHRSCNDKPPPPRSWDQTSVCSSSSQPVMGVRHPPFIHSHSSPDSGSTANVLDTKHGRVCSTISLHGIPADTLARVVDLEDYHYSRQQVWELATQGATLLKDKSRSSLDVAAGAEGWTEDPSHIQQAASTEAGLLEKSLEEHQLEHLQTLLKRYLPVEEEDVQIWSKVRYNDTGSREDIREEVIEMISGESSDDSNSSIESELLKQQSRQLWELRATLEDEEDKLSDTQEADDDPPDENPTELPDILASHATSFESTAEVSCDDPGYECDESDYLQLPSHELRRHCYKSLLSKRLQKRTPGGESSFDSWESSSTDRTEGATTSFESTTDNTDSTGEGQTNRLQQMKADSGYKSMESNGKAPRLCRKQLQFTLEGDSVDQMMTLEDTFDEGTEVLFKTPDVQVTDTIKTKSSIETSKVVSFEGVTIEGEGLPQSELQVHKKKYKSALKKHCTESDIQWSEQLPEFKLSTDQLTVETRGKTSVFQRFFRSGRLRMEHMQQFRDYSIDEKSDALFREFSRHDSEGDYYRSRGPRLHGHMRLHHRSLPSTESSSPHLPRKLLSPQVSIEEESCESGGEEKVDKAGGSGMQQDVSSPRKTQAQISVICPSHGGDGQ
ncbi:uncharacterized protein NPIL_193052 [Nephila pilipes]|uniref:Uncharacterized protein n=1 Tax=Nephila pilipes TaxID=299642 RepID=A0A8X6R553_NEPPI|nr:uncharacterized protein NPIL_193052 [Nephila pilipes]